MPPLMPSSSKIPFYIPKEIMKDHPHLQRAIKNADFPCANCRDNDGNPDWHTVDECFKAGSYEPKSGPHVEGRPSVGPRGMIATVFALTCPTCHCASSNYNTSWMQNSTVDILLIPAGIQRPNRAQASDTKADIFEQEDEEAPRSEKAAPIFGKDRKSKKVSDLNTGKPDKAARARKKAIVAAAASAQ